MVNRERRGPALNAGVYRTMGSVWVVVPCLLVVCILPNLASSLKVVCPMFSNVVSLHKHERVLFNPTDETAVIKIRSEPCNLTYTYLVNVSEDLGNNTELKDIRGQQWYEISYSIVGAMLQVRLVGNTTININRTWDPFLVCNLTNGIEFNFDILTILGEECSNAPISFQDPDMNIFSGLSPNYEVSCYDYGGNYSRQHIIFIPVGAILFVISVCCRCWYRRKRTTQPVRTITVVRSIPPTDECNTEIDLDLPPVYSEIQNEMPPPSYAETQKLAMAPVEALPTELTPTAVETPSVEQGCGEETREECNKYLLSSEPPGAEPAADSRQDESNSSSTLPRMLSCSRNLQTQFSFKPLHEEE